MRVPFSKITPANQDLQALQTNVAATLDPLLNLELLDGRLISNVALVSGADTLVNHGLGRAPLGWIVAGQDANAVIWETASPAPNKVLSLRASATVTANLIIF